MNKQEIEIEMARANVIDCLNDNMYNTALKNLKKLVENLTIEDINENERVCYSN